MRPYALYATGTDCLWLRVIKLKRHNRWKNSSLYSTLTFSKKLCDQHLSLIYNNLFAYKGRTESTIVGRHGGRILLFVGAVNKWCFVVLSIFVTGKCLSEKQYRVRRGVLLSNWSYLLKQLQPSGPMKRARKRATGWWRFRRVVDCEYVPPSQFDNVLFVDWRLMLDQPQNRCRRTLFFFRGAWSF